jgi:general nucleoside transport system permease protein
MNGTVLTMAAASAVASGTPLVLAGLGGLVTEKAGVVNISIEGMMLVGAVAAFLTAHATLSIMLALLAGMLAATALAAVHAFLCVTLKANQIVAGLAIVIFGAGIATFVGKSVEGQPIAVRVVDHKIPMLSEIPVLGRVLFQHDPIVYLSWLLVILVAIYFKYTRLGLITRSVGENAATADVMGVWVTAVQYGHILAGGAFIGLAGAYVVLARVPNWSQASTTSGLGWIAVALVVFSSWRPLRLLAGAYLFGLALRANFTLQAAGLNSIPAEVLAMLPYLLTIAVLMLLSLFDHGNRFGAPAGLGKPYFRNER